MVRDAALAASGLLSPKIGGPSVFPDQPEGIWDNPYSDDKVGDERGRRPLPPRPLHLHPPNVALPEPHDVRCHQPRALHGAERADQHAAAGADAAERRGVLRGGARAGWPHRSEGGADPARARRPRFRLVHVTHADRRGGRPHRRLRRAAGTSARTNADVRRESAEVASSGAALAGTRSAEAANGPASRRGAGRTVADRPRGRWSRTRC